MREWGQGGGAGGRGEAALAGGAREGVTWDAGRAHGKREAPGGGVALYARTWLGLPILPAPRSLTRVGVMVLVCHESNDIFLEAAKVGWRVAKSCSMRPQRAMGVECDPSTGTWQLSQSAGLGGETTSCWLEPNAADGTVRKA